MEDDIQNDNKEYVDISNYFEKPLIKEETVIKEEPIKVEPVVEEEKIVEEPREKVVEEVRHYKPLPQEEPKRIKKTKKGNGIIFILLFLTLASLGTSAYVAYDNHYLKGSIANPQLIYSGDWDCFTERCTEYMTLNEWSKDNCNSELTECKINYQGQDVVLPFEQINLPPEHELLCKSYVCSTEIPIRRYLE